MTPYGRPDAYRESAILTASPEQLVVLLYDGALRFAHQAQAAFGEGAQAHARDRLDRVEAIVDELLATLDMEAGGELAERLQAIYVFCKRCLMQARLERDPEPLGTVLRLLGELRGAWSAVASGQPAPA